MMRIARRSPSAPRRRRETGVHRRQVYRHAPELGDAHHAEAVAMRVAKLGGMPVVPHSLGRVLSGVVPDAFWREGCTLLLSRCDGMLLLPSWGDSPDTVKQSLFAKSKGIERWGIAHLSDSRFFKWLNYPAERGAG